MMEAIDRIIDDRSIDPSEKQLHINRMLLEQGEQGVADAVETILRAESDLPAAYAANFLAGLPGHVAEKNRAMGELLARRPDWAVAIANLIEFAEGEALDRLIQLAVHEQNSPAALSVAYELAQHFPDRMRQHRDHLAPYDVTELLMPGAPDEWVKELVKNYQREQDGQLAVLLSYVRTDSARDALITLLHAAPSGRQAFLAALLESSGVFADSREASTYADAYRGFVGAVGESPHLVDGEQEGAVPVNAVDKKPAEKILELNRGALPFDVRGNFDPIMFWHEGPQTPGHVYVQATKDGLKGIMTPMGKAGDAHRLLPFAGSAVLVKERHPYGFGGAAIGGSGRIQVGGYPQWRTPERFPRCPLCSQGMRFLASVDSGITPLGRFAFDGTLYGFWCERCDVSCTYRQM